MKNKEKTKHRVNLKVKTEFNEYNEHYIIL